MPQVRPSHALYLVTAAWVVLLALLQGWLGGELVTDDVFVQEAPRNANAGAASSAHDHHHAHGQAHGDEGQE